MTNVTKSRILIDTNILYYANTPETSFGKQAIEIVRELALLDNELCISSQIIKEYSNQTLKNAAYHKFDLATYVSIVKRNITRFEHNFNVIYENKDVLKQWLDFLPKLTTHRDIFDFNLAATMFVYNIPYILTHNESDFRKFSDFITVIPLFSK